MFVIYSFATLCHISIRLFFASSSSQSAVTPVERNFFLLIVKSCLYNIITCNFLNFNLNAYKNNFFYLDSSRRVTIYFGSFELSLLSPATFTNADAVTAD